MSFILVVLLSKLPSAKICPASIRFTHTSQETIFDKQTFFWNLFILSRLKVNFHFTFLTSVFLLLFQLLSIFLAYKSVASLSLVTLATLCSQSQKIHDHAYRSSTTTTTIHHISTTTIHHIQPRKMINKKKPQPQPRKPITTCQIARLGLRLTRVLLLVSRNFGNQHR